ncbi:hypothetical protein SAMN05444746_12711 [Variovorax sp. OK212]|nr:hypothetical protein SAMN05518853_12711 [Variovorax sp. OK202]SFE52009.1 hypothetical protein SAMN05444746_12711 [Variovorax sp. OK212]
MPLPFLIELAQRPLPLAVTCPQQSRHVARLKATGLIEATLALSHARQRCTRAALVHALTEEGVQDIAEVRGRLPPRTVGQERHSLALAFLRFLEHADFPAIVTQPDECDAAAHLVAEGLIHGAVDEIGGDSAEAVIRGLTTSGRALLSPRMGKGAMARGRGSRAAERRALGAPIPSRSSLLGQVRRAACATALAAVTRPSLTIPAASRSSSSPWRCSHAALCPAH